MPLKLSILYFIELRIEFFIFVTKNYFYNIKEMYKLVTNVVLGYSSLSVKLINDRCESVCMSGTQKIHYIIKYIRNTNYFRFLK